MKDVRVPEQLMRAMAAEAEAAREARAKVIAAEGEHKASRSLRQAAEVIVENPAALQLRYLQTLNSISGENSNTIIFPVPLDFCSVSSFLSKSKVTCFFYLSTFKPNPIKRQVGGGGQVGKMNGENEPFLV